MIIQEFIGIVKLLIDKGSDVNIKYNNGFS
jgi:hypothetical protein